MLLPWEEKRKENMKYYYAVLTMVQGSSKIKMKRCPSDFISDFIKKAAMEY
jgi:hypothetical protein